jgi:hypothetical protein
MNGEIILNPGMIVLFKTILLVNCLVKLFAGNAGINLLLLIFFKTFLFRLIWESKILTF